MITHTQVVAEIDAYLEATGMLPTQFGAKALGDKGFVTTLRRGRSPTLATIERLAAYMTAHPPKRASKPARPSP